MSNLSRYQRRQLLQALGLAGGALLAGGLGAGCTTLGTQRLDRLELNGPAAPPTVLLAHLAEQERLRTLVPDTTVGIWQSPDQLRAGVTSGQYQVAAVPTYVAANLYQRGLPVRLLNVTVWGILHVMAADDGVRGWSDLAGRRILVPFKGDMPDLVFRYLARQHGLDPASLDVQYTSAPVEALQLLMAGHGQAAVLSEPVATAAELRGKQQGIPIRRVLDLQAEWAAATGGPPRIPQAGTLALTSLTERHPNVVRAIQAGLADAVSWVREAPAEAAQVGSKLIGLEAPMVERSLPRTPLEMVTAADARGELEQFFSHLAELSPEIIGGTLPDAAFYVG